ncbi:J domain-containing protein [Dactylosporangium sp. NPDC006015]|uniref:J domain-containing protein n=1 Tax=Dactylosporangium sp. NPDC006015 TaxID=3154576 RepID=UPI0033BE2B1C
MSERRDPYQVLGVARTATPEEIQRAYRTLARRQHPDINKEPGAEDRFKEINEAYHVLSDPERRARHDKAGRERARPRGVQTVDIDDLFSSMFGGRYGTGADTEARITVGVEEAFRGGRRTVTLPDADGRPRRYDVNIPAGVVDGQRIRLAGQGAPGVAGGPPGDLYLVVALAPHPRFRVQGRDVVLDLPVAPWEAALGARVPLDAPGGPVRVDVPAGTSSGRRLRLRGQGLPNPRGRPGDLYAEVRIMVPATLSTRERHLFEELGKASAYDPRGR